MNLTSRLVAVPALAVALTGLSVAAANATTDPLPTDAVDALVTASCQLDPANPLTLEEMAPTNVGESDVAVVPGEISLHVVRAEVTTSAADVRLCTVGVLHRDALLKQVKYEGTATLGLGDGLGGTVESVVTTVDLGNMGRGPVDPRTQLAVGGFLTPVDGVVEDPTFSVSLARKSLEVVQVAVSRTVKDAATRLLNAQLKAAAQLQAKELKAARSKHSAKAVAAAQRAYATRVAAAQAAYNRTVAPKTVTRPVSRSFSVDGSVAVSLG